MVKLHIAALLLIGAAPAAHAVTVAYTYDSAGDGIQLVQTGFLAAGFTFTSACGNQQTVSGFRIKSGNDHETWGVTVPSGDPNGIAAMILDETARTWTLYYENGSYGVPWQVVNSGSLTKVKAC